jgi:hypothetical protein
MKVILLRDKMTLSVIGVFAANSENRIPQDVIDEIKGRGYRLDEYHPSCPNQDQWIEELLRPTLGRRVA